MDFYRLKKLYYTLRNIRTTVRAEYGAGISGFLAFFRYSLLSINRFKLYVFDLDDYEAVDTGGDGVVISAPSMAELGSLRDRYDLPREFYYDRIHGLSQCILITIDGTPAYIHWIYRSGQPSRFFRIDRSCAEINNCVTIEAFRGRGLMTKACKYTFMHLCGGDVKQVLMAVHRDNIASNKAAVRAGFVAVGEKVAFGHLNSKVQAVQLVARS